MDNPFSVIDERLANIEKCLIKIMSAISLLPEKEPILKSDVSFNIEELARYLNVTKATISKYKRERIFPYYQAGRTVFFKKDEVDAALSSGKRKRH